MDEFVAATGAAGRVVYEPFSKNSLRSASNLVFGRSVLPEFDLSSADLVLDFSSDFLDQGLSPVEHAGQFAAAKETSKHGGASLISVGPRLSMTASKADKWIASAPGGEGALALALAMAIFPKKPRSVGVTPAMKARYAGSEEETYAQPAMTVPSTCGFCSMHQHRTPPPHLDA